MLQWMGGSRRKVTASRKSIQKRQHQYFEQRRQQQQQQPTCTEGYTSGVNVVQQHQKEQGSLDVLSFLNLSNISQNTKSSHPKGNGDQHTNCHTRTSPQSSITNSFSGCAAETDEARIAVPLPGHEDTTLPAEKDSFCSHNDHVSSKINSKPDLWNVASEGVSVFDLLADDDGEENLQDSSVHESHVAFSVEGLGTVGAETPPQSPTQHVRTSHGHCFPLGMTARELGFSNNVDYFIASTEPQVDVMMQDMVLPLGGSSSDVFPGLLDSHEKERQKPSFFADCVERDSCSCALKGSFGSRNNIFSYNWENSWEDTPSFVDDFLDERGDDSRKTWPDKPYGRSNQFVKASNYMRPDYMARGANLLKKRDYEITEFSTPDSPSPQNQKVEFNHDFSRNPIIGKSSAFSFGDIGFQQDWPNPGTECTKDTTSLLSEEESCSSSAVWGGESNNRDPDITSRRSGRTCDIFGSTWSKQSPVDIYAKEENHKQRDGLRRSHIPGPGMCWRKPVSPDSVPPEHISTGFEDKTEMSESLLFGGSHSLKGKVDFGPFTDTSNTDFQSLYSKPQKADLVAAFPAPDRHVDVNSIFNLEKSAFSQPFDCTTRYEKSPVFSNIGCGPTRDLCLNSTEEMPCKSPLDEENKSELQQNGRTCNIFGSTRSKQSPAGIYAKEANHKQRDGLRRNHIPVPGMCTGKSISPESIPPKHISSWFEDKTEMSENLLFGGSHSVKRKIDFGCFTHTSNTDFPSLYSEPRDVNSIFSQEKSAFSQPFDCTRYEKSPVFSNVVCEPIRDLCPNSAEAMPSKGPLDVASARWNSETPALSAQVRARRNEDNKSELKSLEFCHQDRTSGTSQKVSSTKDQMARASLTPKIADVGLKQETDGTSNSKLEAKAADETESSVRIPEKSDSTVDQNGASHASEASLPCPSGSTGTENAMPEEARLTRKNQGDAINASSQQVMMLEGYVLQFLCAQKVPEVKRVSTLEIIKK